MDDKGTTYCARRWQLKFIELLLSVYWTDITLLKHTNHHVGMVTCVMHMLFCVFNNLWEFLNISNITHCLKLFVDPFKYISICFVCVCVYVCVCLCVCGGMYYNVISWVRCVTRQTRCTDGMWHRRTRGDRVGNVGN